MRITIEINFPPLFDLRSWSARFRAVATTMSELSFNPFRLQIDLRTPAATLPGECVIRSGEWWDMYFKAKAEYDLMRSHVVVNCDPCLPAVRWDGSAMPERNCPQSRH